MYNKLQEQAKIERIKKIKNAYNICNKEIDEHAELGVAFAMSKGHKQWNLFYEESPTINYDKLFKVFYKKPYDKPIIKRLQEKFPEPEFKCVA